MEHAYVVVLSAPSGFRMLSHASLMTAEEAEHEAESWRRTPCTRGPGNWAADALEVPLVTRL